MCWATRQAGEVEAGEGCVCLCPSGDPALTRHLLLLTHRPSPTDPLSHVTLPHNDTTNSIQKKVQLILLHHGQVFVQ
ncbi:hypothetical protein E2C01_042246 [Portunus trituberculatus]|uniref:Uncharacterized protein n=1 Tax=Portunus trituberculatus TaxID=210409 RepID=A0A5B7FU37_PORTR|nr:hypothetical protein [Portunus trituberculatus]